MATKETEGQENSRVSKLPLPLSDQPLVIDLPDGQKLVIGKMTQGSVIEVATWRGTGRPDSRTSRLMLGMSVNDSNEPASTQTTGYAQVPAAAPEKLSPVQKVISVVTNTLKSVGDIALKSLRKVTPATQFLLSKFGKNTASKRRPDAPKQIEDVRPHPISEDAEIEAWLNKLTEKAAKKTARDMAAASAPMKKSGSKSASKRTTATKKTAKKK
jgi:hypothetical protein